MKITSVLALIAAMGVAPGAVIAAETFDTQHGKIKVETVAEGMSSPWGIDFLPDGRMIVTEKAGYLRIVDKNGNRSEALPGVPRVGYVGQGGLLDVMLHLPPVIAAEKSQQKHDRDHQN